MSDFDVRLRGDLLLSDQALTVARRFAFEYPDRVGRRDGVIYADGPRKFYAYRTPTGQIVVRSEVSGA